MPSNPNRDRAAGTCATANAVTRSPGYGAAVGNVAAAAASAMDLSRVLADDLQAAELSNWIDARAKAHGFDHWGLAEVDLSQAEAGLLQWLAAGFHGGMDYMARNPGLRVQPSALFPGARSALMVAASYRPEDPDWMANRWGQLARREQAVVSMYALGRDYHRLMRRQLQRLGEDLGRWFAAHPDALPDPGAASDPGAAPLRFRAFCDSGPLFEVELARKAGLGWRGKNTLLLHRERGSLFFLGTLLSNLSPTHWVNPTRDQVASPAETGHCGSCQACLEICPTRAIVAPYRLDARRCIAYLTIEHHGPIPEEFRAPIGNRIYGCDDCQLICPWNKFAVSLKLPGLRARPAIGALELVEAMSWDESAFLYRTEGSAIRRIGYRRWLRNVAVALGNLLESPGPEPAPGEIRLALRAIAVLRARRKEVDPMVAEHIDWALRRLEAKIARSPSADQTLAASARS